MDALVFKAQVFSERVERSLKVRFFVRKVKWDFRMIDECGGGVGPQKKLGCVTFDTVGIGVEVLTSWTSG